MLIFLDKYVIFFFFHFPIHLIHPSLFASTVTCDLKKSRLFLSSSCVPSWQERHRRTLHRSYLRAGNKQLVAKGRHQCDPHWGIHVSQLQHWEQQKYNALLPDLSPEAHFLPQWNRHILIKCAACRWARRSAILDHFWFEVDEACGLVLSIPCMKVEALPKEHCELELLGKICWLSLVKCLVSVFLCSFLRS